MIQEIAIDKLYPHPDNRPLGINEEKVEQLAEMMKANGYDQSKPLKARPNGKPGHYQIIEGEHRWRAAQKAGIDSIPVFVKELSDKDALIELVAGNVQTGNDNIDIGVIALRLKEDHGVKYREYAASLGKSENTVSGYAKAGDVFRVIKNKIPPGGDFCREDAKLEEISRCKECDWLWLHNLTVSKSLTKQDVIDASKRTRQIDTTTKPGHAAKIFNLTEIKQECATAKERIYQNWIDLLEAVEDCAEKLPEAETLFRYNFKDKAIEKYEYPAREKFLSVLSELKSFNRADVFRQYDATLKTIRQQTKENAENDQKYYQHEANRKEAEERERAEWEAFMPEPGTWYELGPHRLYCGDNRDPDFINALPDNAAFAFADPPYNAGVDEWDSGFVWEQDYLQDKSEFVFVTPGIGNINGLFAATKMFYKWSISAWITNGMTRGALGFGNWIYIALFSKNESVHRNEQDFIKVNISNPSDKDHTHRGEKPKELLDNLVKKFSKEGDIILDPFLGSGTTLFSCDDNLRVCIGAEINPVYCKDIIAKYKNNGKD